MSVHHECGWISVGVYGRKLIIKKQTREGAETRASGVDGQQRSCLYEFVASLLLLIEQWSEGNQSEETWPRPLAYCTAPTGICAISFASVTRVCSEA